MKEGGILILLSIVTVIFISGVQSVCNDSNKETEQMAHGVELKIYRITVSEFQSESIINKFTAQISAYATEYCQSNAGACGLTNYSGSFPFKDNHVATVSGPTESLKDIKVTFALDLPPDIYAYSNEAPDCVVKKLALQDIVGNARVAIHEDTGYWITYVDTIYYGIPPPTKLNQIIIPIASAVLLGIILLAIGLNIWNKRREAAERRAKILEQRKKSKKPKNTPVYSVPSDDPKAPGGVDGKNKDQLYKDNLRKSDMMTKKLDTASEDSAIRVDNEPRHRQGYAFEKRPDGATGGESDMDGKQYGHLAPIEQQANDETKEKGKKKKKKRSKSKEAMDGVQNEGYQWTERGLIRMTSFN